MRRRVCRKVDTTKPSLVKMLAIMVYGELLNIIALIKCEDHHTKKLI